MSCKPWLLFLTFTILTNTLAIVVTAQNYGCFGDTNYTANSTYSSNLNSLLQSLPSQMDDSGFHNASQGEVYATALCRSDTQLDECRTCVRGATTELLGLCPNRKQGVLFQETCTLRYSDDSIFGIKDDAYRIYIHVLSNVSSPDQFQDVLTAAVNDLRGQAASGGARMKVGAGNRTAPDFQMIFALLQCTPDISENDCTGCLINIAQDIPNCCNRSPFVRILSPSCNLRYQLQPFYNMSRIEEARAAVSPTPPPPPPAPTAADPVPSTPPGDVYA